jgi:glycosyltransferase involved in cell wall biosynthesis
VLEAYKELVICVRQENGGQSSALNLGWKMSKGDILGYLSSDDRLRPEAIAGMVREMVKDQQAIVCCCDYSVIDSSGAEIKRVVPNVVSRKRMIEDLICIPGPGALFKRRAFEITGGWNAKFRQIPDLDFWLRLAQYGSIIKVNEVYAEWRAHDQSTSFRPVHSARSDEIIECVEELWQKNSENLKSIARPRPSRAMARALSARSHFMSGRHLAGLLRCVSALTISPGCAIRPSFWRPVVIGLVFKWMTVSRVIGRKRQRSA